MTQRPIYEVNTWDKSIQSVSLTAMKEQKHVLFLYTSLTNSSEKHTLCTAWSSFVHVSNVSVHQDHCDRGDAVVAPIWTNNEFRAECRATNRNVSRSTVIHQTAVLAFLVCCLVFFATTHCDLSFFTELL